MYRGFLECTYIIDYVVNLRDEIEDFESMAGILEVMQEGVLGVRLSFGCFSGSVSCWRGNF